MEVREFFGVLRKKTAKPAKKAAEVTDAIVPLMPYDREMNGSSPDVAAGAVHHALTASKPRSRYGVGKHATLLPAVAVLLPDACWTQFNFVSLGCRANLVRWRQHRINSRSNLQRRSTLADRIEQVFGC